MTLLENTFVLKFWCRYGFAIHEINLKGVANLMRKKTAENMKTKS